MKKQLLNEAFRTLTQGASFLQGIRREAKNVIKNRLRRVLVDHFDLVTKEDMEHMSFSHEKEQEQKNKASVQTTDTSSTTKTKE